MDWKPVIGGLLQTVAPKIASVLVGEIPIVGPLLAGLSADAVGAIIASQFGVPATPEAVAEAIQNTPTDIATQKLAAAEAEATAKWPALAEIAKAEAADRTAQSQAINETARVEIASGVSWWHWRNLIGYLVLAYGIVLLSIMVRVAFFPMGASARVSDFVDLFNATTAFTIGLFGLLGYIAQDSTKLKTAAITGEQAPSLTNQVVTAVKGVTKKVR